MKNFILGLLILFPLITFSQHEKIATDWKKEKDRILINNKMNELIDRVSFELECDTSNITYTVVEKYYFYGRKKDMMNFPRKLTVKACGHTLGYINDCPPNSYGKPKGWIMGEWIVDPEFKKE